jgi:hypothetical protein
MSYNPSMQVFYCKQSEIPGAAHRIAPAPSISISPEIYYANDNVIGYTYTITLSGYANALRKEINAGSTLSGANETIGHMGDIREIFNVNGGNLYIKQGNSNIIIAKGATIKNINFNPSNNRWVNYSPYTIEIEFNEIDFTGCSNNPIIPCNGSIFHTGQTAGILSDKLIDIKKYKIKEFNDKWTITIDNTVYEQANELQNGVFKVSYTLSATGKNYYVNDKLIPAWQQAKLFVQDRLYDQVNALFSKICTIDNSDTCSASRTMSQLHDKDQGSPLIQGFTGQKDGANPTHNIYNEIIVCDTSESTGSFSITYSAIVKKFMTELSIPSNAVLHSYTKSITTVDQNTPQNTTITIQGTIQGLVRGGFIYYAGNNFTLPKTGQFIIGHIGSETKYSNALSFYNQQISGDSIDLYGSHKNLLGVNAQALSINIANAIIKPLSFSVDHNYGQGSITYNATYDSNHIRSLTLGYTNLTVVHNEPIDIIQEFIIPGRTNGPIIQKLNMKTSRTINVTIEGADERNKGCVIDEACAAYPYTNDIDTDALFEDRDDIILINEDFTTNKIDGSFVISLEYLCTG